MREEFRRESNKASKSAVTSKKEVKLAIDDMDLDGMFDELDVPDSKPKAPEDILDDAMDDLFGELDMPVAAAPPAKPAKLSATEAYALKQQERAKKKAKEAKLAKAVSQQQRSTSRGKGRTQGPQGQGGGMDMGAMMAQMMGAMGKGGGGMGGMGMGGKGGGQAAPLDWKQSLTLLPQDLRQEWRSAIEKDLRRQQPSVMPKQRQFSRAYGSGIKGRRTAAAARGMTSEGTKKNEEADNKQEEKETIKGADEDDTTDAETDVQMKDYDAQTHLQVMQYI
jgi:hypothetical protein